VSDASSAPPTGERRLSTGIPELDRMLDGGLMPHRPYLVVGPSGTGKTTLALQFLCEGVRHGERALFVTVEEPPNEILWNHRRLLPDLAKVEVFDAIPDVMRFERTPFKDIASVRQAVPFERVDLDIRRTPELTSVEVTISALEQMLRTEVQRKAYTRVVVDSLTALQYFCMKGYEPAAGAQSFLRFLSDLRITTVLTVEAPVEDVETPERMLARGEIRLFRWEVDGVTVRAVGVEKFRGSSHDVRLHPYRIGTRGIDVNLLATISRDTQEVVAATPAELETTGEPPIGEPGTVELLFHEVRDALLVGEDLATVRAEVEGALAATRRGELQEAANHITRALAAGAIPPELNQVVHHTFPAPAEAALARILARAETARVGVPPARLPEPPILAAQLTRLLNEITVGTKEVSERAPFPAPRTERAVVPTELEVAQPGTGVPPTPVAVMPPPTAPSPAPEPTIVAAPAPVAPPSGPATPPVAAPPVPAASHEPSPPLPPAPAAVSSPPKGVPPPESQAPPLPSPAVVRAATPPPSKAPVEPIPAGPRPRVRAEPPPLPTRVPFPEVTAAPRPLPPPPSHAGPAAPAAHPPVSPTVPPAAPVSAPVPTPATPAPTPATATPRRRKRAPTLKKKPEPPVEVAAVSPVAPIAAPPPATPAPGVEPTAAPAVEPPALPKPKRRVVRKKKAPPVVAATPGPVPEGVPGSDAQPAPVAPAPPTPPKEGG
jgi:KaiC/GvpD/RAD55 family RecA-like ATPase